MKLGVYHKDIGFPKGTRWPAGTFPLRYSQHALHEAGKDHFGDFSTRLPPELDLAQAQVIEAQVDEERRVRLMVCRTRLDVKFDIVLVVQTSGTVWLVRTTYLNRRGDQHRTLNRARYDCPLEVV